MKTAKKNSLRSFQNGACLLNRKQRKLLSVAKAAALRPEQEHQAEETARTLMRECGDERDYF